MIEIFHFEPSLPPQPVAWSRIGLTHICLNVRGIQKWHDYLVSKGVEIVSPPEQSPRGHWLFFVKDFDGNLIEITDLGYMYHVLNWLGPLGGWVFRRGHVQEVLRVEFPDRPESVIRFPTNRRSDLFFEERRDDFLRVWRQRPRFFHGLQRPAGRSLGVALEHVVRAAARAPSS